MIRAFFALVVCLSMTAVTHAQETAQPLKLLFLGDDGHHRPQERFRNLQPVLEKRNINLTYTDKLTSLDAKVLVAYDGLVIYANHTKISPDQEKALLDYVEGGKGFIPLHCASYCFLNSPKYIDLVGGQFKSHGTGVVETTQAKIKHPILKNFVPFKSFDETYVHTKHNEKDRIVLEFRDEKGKPEPWTWVRTQGKGRIFYTAWGHDARTWTTPGFANLVERGIRWATGDDKVVATVTQTEPAKPTKAGLKPFEYVEAKVPFYPPSATWGKTTEPLSKMQKPVEPDESIKHMVVPKGMKVELFAAEPQIYRPICMNWDEKGRLWICETIDYPNELQKRGEGRDRIVICDDSDGDGKADKFSVFADKLSIPTSMAFANGGVIVSQAPDMLFLKDTNGDGVADERKVLFTGWGTRDTHAGPSNLHYGFDNWIYGIVGYSGFKGTVNGETHSFGNGFFRFKPDGSKLEFLRNTSNNSWGVGFSEDGILFGSTANGNASVHLPIPNRYYEKVRGWSSSVLPTIADSQNFYPITEKVRQVDFHGKFTAGAGHALYTARTYPKEYWNKVSFVAEPTGHLVAHFKLEPKGATFVAKNSKNFLASDDEWTAPIAAEVGPDGNMWVIDWYNYIVQHNPTPPGFKTGKGAAYETPLRDKTHGRIVRVVHSAGKASVAPKLDVNHPAALVAALKHDNLFWRRHAQRLLVERGKADVIPSLVELALDAAVDEIGLNVGAMHALWTLHGLGAPVEEKIFGQVRQHKSPGVRRAAVMTAARQPSMAPIIADMASDADAQVRLAALLALAEIPAPVDAKVDAKSAVGDKLVGVLRGGDLGSDRWLLDAATCAIAAHDRAFFTSLGRQTWEAKDKTIGWTTIVERVADHYARSGPVDSVGGVVASLPQLPKALSGAMLAGLARGWPSGKQPALDAAAEQALENLLKTGASSQGSALVSLAKRWNVAALERHFAAIADGYMKQLRDEKEDDANRAVAVQSIVELRGTDPKLLKDLSEFLSPRTAPVIARNVIDALGRSDIPGLGGEIAAMAPTLTPSVRPTAIRVLLSKPEWTGALLDSLDKGTIAADALSLDQKQGLLSHPVKALAARARATFAKSGGIPSPDREKVVNELLPLVKDDGDAKLGKAVFLQHCAKCHRHGAEGAKIGPDLTGMAVHPKSHLLIEIMDPNRSVEGNYRQYVITTKAGRVLTGLLASESKTAVEIVDGEAKTQSLQRDDIDELQATTKSLMPEGFEKQLPAKDLVNLLTFLTQRGQYLPLPLAKVATTISTKGMFLDEENTAERLIFREWTPQTVEGVPFQLVDPEGNRARNVIVLAGGPKGSSLVADNPRSVSLPCNAPAKAIHLLSGVAGWGYPFTQKGTVSMIVRLHYVDGSTEDHTLKNGEHFADYIRRVDVPDSKFAFALRGQQIRLLSVQPQKSDVIERIEFVKGSDTTAPVIMAVTVETRP